MYLEPYLLRLINDASFVSETSNILKIRKNMLKDVYENVCGTRHEVLDGILDILRQKIHDTTHKRDAFVAILWPEWVLFDEDAFTWWTTIVVATSPGGVALVSYKECTSEEDAVEWAYTQKWIWSHENGFSVKTPNPMKRRYVPLDKTVRFF